MKTEIVYREIAGAGDDQEHSSKADGVAVTLSYFESDNFKAPSHYVLEQTVILDREIVTHTHTLILSGWRTLDDPRYIRQAISTFDQLVAAHPILGAVKSEE